MKTILPVALLFLWLLHSSAAEPENQETLKKSELNLVRDIREPGRIQKNPDKKVPKRRKSKNQFKNKEARKSQQKNNKQKNGKGKKKSKGKKSRNGKTKKNPLLNKKKKNKKYYRKVINRQNTCSVTCVTDKQKLYNRYVNQLRKINNINRFLRLITNKKNKGKTAFDEAIKIIDEQTKNGTSCDGGKPDSETMNAYYTLSSCPESTQKLCNYTLSSSDDSLINICKVSLDTYVAEYEVCLRNTPTCVCFDALTVVDSKCTDFDPLLTSIKEFKSICLDGAVNGSFVYCRKQEQLLPSIINKCNPLPPKQSTTTVSTTTAAATTTAASTANSPTTATATTTAASTADSPTDKNIKVAVGSIIARMGVLTQKLVASKISSEAAAAIFPKSDKCPNSKGIKCLAILQWAVYECIDDPDPERCVKRIIGPLHQCYDCICWVIEHITGIKCSQATRNRNAMEAVLSDMINRFGVFTADIISDESSITIFPPYPNCTVDKGKKCETDIKGAVEKCLIESSLEIITACVEAIVTAENECYPCICWVLQQWGFFCGYDENAGSKLAIQYLTSSRVALAKEIESESLVNPALPILPIFPNGTTCLKCMDEIAWVIEKCLVYVGDGNVTACIEKIIQPVDECYACICWIKELLGIPCILEDSTPGKLKSIANSMSVRHYSLVKSVNNATCGLTDAPDCYDTDYDCTPEIYAESQKCFHSMPCMVQDCVEKKYPDGVLCHKCICPVLKPQNFPCYDS